MFLLYLDESGSVDAQHFVVGGLAVHEQDAFHLARDVDQLLSTLPARFATAELHAQQIRLGKGIWHTIGRQERDQLTTDIASLLVRKRPSAYHQPVLFAVAIHKDSFPQHDPYERAYEDFFARCNGFLGRLARGGDRHRCVCIADKSRLESTLQELMAGWRTAGASTGAAIGPMTSYAEVPLFVDSAASRLIQLADFVAHWVYRAYESGDQSVLQHLFPAFDEDGGPVHGLVHLVDRYWECECRTCRSRRH